MAKVYVTGAVTGLGACSRVLPMFVRTSCLMVWWLPFKGGRKYLGHRVCNYVIHFRGKLEFTWSLR